MIPNGNASRSATHAGVAGRQVDAPDRPARSELHEVALPVVGAHAAPSPGRAAACAGPRMPAPSRSAAAGRRPRTMSARHAGRRGWSPVRRQGRPPAPSPSAARLVTALSKDATGEAGAASPQTEERDAPLENRILPPIRQRLSGVSASATIAASSSSAVGIERAIHRRHRDGMIAAAAQPVPGPADRAAHGLAPQ